ncbi:MAG: sulfatase-like hydrolase/transferase, partial [Candidatus Latescibacteria bacterium]|nr:sulfatase-like hydrolase/transferase [Candidatus Latescibacterota bacterium]
MPHPNLIILMADQLRFDLIGSEHTPNINQLISESTVFNRAYCASPLCVPARGAFFTGTYPNTNGSLINPWEPNDAKHGNVKAGTPNLYTLLENDWDSWHTGKQHLYTEEKIDQSPNSKTHWLSQNGYGKLLQDAGVQRPGGSAFRGMMPEMAEGRITRLKKYSIPTTGCYEPGLDYFFDGYIKNQSLKSIRNRDKNKPFSLNTMFVAPHPPLDIPEPFYSQVKHIDLPENVGLWSAGQSPLQLYNLTGALGGRYTRDDWQEIWRVYAGLVALLDHCIGEIIAELKAHDLYDNSLILFTADHGEMLGSHCLWQKMCMYEESTRAPLVFKLPKGQKGVAQNDTLVSHIDVLPTLCDLLGIDTPSNVEGLSLKNAMERGANLDREHIFIQFDGNGALGNFQRCLIRGHYKLIVDLFQNETYFELYDIINDPQEKINLAFKEQNITRECLDILTTIM